MASIRSKNCPLCGVFIKAENFGRHIERVHSRYSQRCDTIRIDSSRCPLCGKVNNPLDNRNNLSICNTHYVEDIRPFLIRNFYIKLRERNNIEFESKTEAAFWTITRQLSLINALLGWTPEDLSESQFLAFNEASAFTGYMLLRLLEVVPSVAERLFAYTESGQHEIIPKKLEQPVDRLLMLIDAEFELFLGIKLGSNGYYDIAVDDELTPKIILIVPSVQPDSVRRLLLFRLRDANEQWHGTFRKILVPYGTSTAKDEFGASFHFERTLIKKHFETFRTLWNEVFGSNSKMTASDFENLWDWLEWVVSTEGITENNQSKATYFEDYKGFGLNKTLVFETLREVLPDLNDSSSIISLRELGKTDIYFRVHFDLASTARGFRVSSTKGFVYYFPCRKWFYNKIMPVFLKFAKKLKLLGPSFEKDIATFSSFYSKAGISTGDKAAFGFMIEPRSKKKSMSLKSSRSAPWRILEKNYPIKLKDPNSVQLVGESGSIDLIVYANMNLYLIELKALNREDRHAIKYMKKKGLTQCAKYAAWVREKDEFENLLERHKIKENQLNSVRILACSSGIFRDLSLTCQATGESFAIVSEFVLFSTMTGLFHLSLKNPFLSRVGTISAGLKITDDNVSQVEIVDNDKALRNKITEQLVLWMKLITYDRRKKYENVTVEEKDVRRATFFETGYLMNELYLGDTVSWVLPKPLLIGKDNQYSFYLGTQIGNAGTTIACENCCSAIKFYWPDERNKEVPKIEAIFASSKCPLCGKPVKESNKTKEILNTMTKMMAKFKYELGESLE